MKSVIHAIESFNIWIGRAFGWCILVLTFSVSYEVFVRYVLNAPTVWAFDMMVQMYGALFLMAGPYALAQDAHVRADVVYRLLPVRWQARIDFTLYLLFFFPGMLALFWFGWEIAADSWRYKEVSWNSPARIQIYFFKTLIPGMHALLPGDEDRGVAEAYGGCARDRENPRGPENQPGFPRGRRPEVIL
jgi:TRAP-type mannitol/chloroaromatic compound transport system permease small subunit